jgi:glyoxylase-like metal-dependent hydrolase (beta-lactamase superfamily II)
MKKLGEYLYVYPDSCQVYIIKNQDKAVLIDFGSGDVLDCLEQTGVTEVTDILITHHHRDQVQGLKRAQENGIPIWVPHQERDLIADADGLWQRREIYNNYNNRQDRFSILSSVPVTGTLEDYSVRTFNGIEFHILPTPGHTVGSISIAAELDREKLCFTGDLIYEGRKVWSLAATQWTYNGGEGLPYHILSLLSLKERKFERLFPSHGGEITDPEDIDEVVDKLWRLIRIRKHNARLFLFREHPYEKITEHVLLNRTSMANSYVLVSESGKALFLDFGYDFIAGVAAGSDRSSRRPWLYTIPKLFTDYGVKEIDACIPTHYHDDHVAGLNLLREVYHARLLCPENFADILQNPSRYDLPCLWYDPVPADETLPFGQKLSWEEYELTLHELPGHTKYAAAIEFAADGKRFLCTGDQYADEDGLFCNYVYKNKFDFDDFIKSAELYQRVCPDIILSGHWIRREYTKEYGDKLMRLGKEVSELHRALLPAEVYVTDTEDFLAVIDPYQLEVEKNEAFTLHIKVKNPFRKEAVIRIKLVLPEGFEGETEFAQAAAPLESISVTAKIKASCMACRRMRIACDITIDERRFGEQAEMLVTIR